MWSEIAFWPLLWVWLVIVVRNALVFIHLNEPQWCSARCFGTQLAMNICEDAPSWPCKLLSQMPPTQCKKLWNRWHDMRLSRLGNPWEDKPWLWAVGLHRSIPDVNQAQALSIPEQFCPPHHHRCHHLPAYDVGSKNTRTQHEEQKDSILTRALTRSSSSASSAARPVKQTNHNLFGTPKGHGSICHSRAHLPMQSSGSWLSCAAWALYSTTTIHTPKSHVTWDFHYSCELRLSGVRYMLRPLSHQPSMALMAFLQPHKVKRWDATVTLWTL